MNPAQIISKLEALDYFTYISKESVPKFKTLLEAQLKNGWLNMPNQYFFNENKNRLAEQALPTSIDRRSMNVDGTHIFRGGLESMLGEFKPIFESRNLAFEISSNIEDYSGVDNKYLKHIVTINKREYIIFDDVPERGMSEMVYLKSLFNLLNEELSNQNYDDESFITLTSIESLYFILIDKPTIEFINSISNTIQNKIIDLNCL